MSYCARKVTVRSIALGGANATRSALAASRYRSALSALFAAAARASSIEPNVIESKRQRQRHCQRRQQIGADSTERTEGPLYLRQQPTD